MVACQPVNTILNWMEEEEEERRRGGGVMPTVRDKKFEKGQVSYMLRLVDTEVMGCTECGDTTIGSNTAIKYVWVVTKQVPNLGGKDELDVYCPGCWEKEVD